ncbi:MAG: hypothetical protein R2769_13925 [Saprospiraceae bacterium]
MKKLILSMMLFASMTFVFTSCQKDKDLVQDDSLTLTSEDYTALQNITDDMDEEFDIVMDGFADNTVTDRSACVTITSDQPWGTFPNTITLDYGSGCTANNGRELSGIITIEISAAPGTTGATRTITFDNFTIDGASVNGFQTWTNDGDAAGYPCFTRTVDKTITFPNGTSTSFEGTHSLCKIEGSDTPARADDVYEINGSMSGENRAGNTFTAFITIPLIKPRACHNIVSGTVEITRNSDTGTLDYGDGNCDRIATVTLPDGTTKNVFLRVWWR